MSPPAASLAIVRASRVIVSRCHANDALAGIVAAGYRRGNRTPRRRPSAAADRASSASLGRLPHRWHVIPECFNRWLHWPASPPPDI
ncbi:hypothetical protein [Lysobacter gummosus]|uniref:hypothetical protein n=1 Tax=Lysobacter gummosus TaxID=262324 RepID=UPI00362DD142